MFKQVGQQTEKRGPAQAGDTVAFGKLDYAKTGDTLSTGKQPHAALAKVTPYPPVLANAVSAKERKDDVKLGAAFTKLTEEDPSIGIVHNAEIHEVVIWGQGEMHLRVATERLGERYRRADHDAGADGRLSRDHQEADHADAAATRSSPAATASSATSCWRSSRCRARQASSSRTASPAAWCRAITFRRSRRASSTRSSTARSASRWSMSRWRWSTARITRWIPPTWRSSTAGRIAIVEGLPQCQPVLLEPIYQVEIVCPTDATAKMNAILSGRRGHILGFDTREGWDGWDIVRAQMAEAEIGDLIIEVRSATAGVGSFTFKFDHMAELTGRTADQIVAARKSSAAA